MFIVANSCVLPYFVRSLHNTAVEKGWKGVLNLVLTNGKFRGNQQHG